MLRWNERSSARAHQHYRPGCSCSAEAGVGDYFRVALDSLETIAPHVRRIELRGLDHPAAGNRDKGGQPGRRAEPLRRFFAGAESGFPFCPASRSRSVGAQRG